MNPFDSGKAPTGGAMPGLQVKPASQALPCHAGRRLRLALGALVAVSLVIFNRYAFLWQLSEFPPSHVTNPGAEFDWYAVRRFKYSNSTT